MIRIASRVSVAVWMLAFTLTSFAQTSTQVYIPPNGSTFNPPNTVYAAGTLHPNAVGNVALTFNIDDPLLGLTQDPNFDSATLNTYDVGAMMGNPGQYIAWSGSMSPTAAGWTLSPIAWFVYGPYSVPMGRTPDHYVTIARNAAGITINISTGPHSVY